MIKYEVSIVIVGGGAAGLAAADFAARHGESVMIVEKMGIIGGCANMAAGVMAYESKLQKQLQETLTVEEAFQEQMELTHYSTDAKLTKKVFSMSKDIIEWLEELGVQFTGVYKYHPMGQRVWHIVQTPGSNRPGTRAAAAMMKTIADDVTERGVRVLFQTEAKEIIMDQGCAVGIRAVGDSGTEIEIQADVVLIATNGFQADSPMGKQLLGDRWMSEAVQGGHSIPGLTGDGMRMLWKVGAQKAPVAMTINTAINGVTDKYKVIESVMEQFDLIVDKNGLRVMNEVYAQDPEYLGQQLIRARGYKLYTIIDSRILEEYKTKGLSWYNPIHTAANLNTWEQELFEYEKEQAIFEDDDPEFAEFFEEINMNPGDFWVCGSVEEIAEKTGIDLDNLKKTIAEYNADAGRQDLLFGKAAQYMKPIQDGPFYVAAYTIASLESRGGIYTDENMRCYNADHEPVKGLYCIGTDANNILGQAISFHRIYGASLSFAFASAKIAVEDAIRYLDEEFEPVS